MKRLLVLLFSLCMCLTVYAIDYSVDLIIIGAGWSGLVAGVAAHDATIETIILESKSSAGGSSQYIRNVSAVGASGAIGLVDAHKAYMTLTNQAADAKVSVTLFREFVANLDWLKTRGAAFIPNNARDYRAAFFSGGNSKLLDYMIDRVNRSSHIRLMLNTPAKELILDQNGRVIGVIAQRDNGEISRIYARYTIIATGPIVGNAEMVAKYMPNMGHNYKVAVPAGRTGDGITLALQAGAKIDPVIAVNSEAGYTMGITSPISSVRDQDLISLYVVATTPYLWLNSRGMRFMNEATAGFNPQAHALNRNNNVYWMILDEQMKNDFINKGLDAMGLPRPFLTPLDNSRLPRLNTALDKAIAAGYAYKADTWDDLATRLRVQPAVLRATIDRQNAFADNKSDEDFMKDAKFLYKYGAGPYYALKAEHTIIGSVGGIQCNERMQVIKDDLSVIPGLYVTGAMIGAMSGDTFPDAVLPGLQSAMGAAASRIIVNRIASEIR